MMRLRLLTAVATVALLGTGVAQAAGPYPPPSKGTGHVEPSRISVGECAVFSGDGFAPVTTVAISDNGAARGTATTNANGDFSKQLCYGSDTQRGRHDLAGAGTGADGAALTVYAVLIVTGVQQSAAHPGTQPGGAASSGGDTGSSGAVASDGSTDGSEVIPVAGGTSGGVQAPPAVEAGGTTTTSVGAADDSATRPLLLGLSALGFAFLASLLLLILARRRRRREDEELADIGTSPLPA